MPRSHICPTCLTELARVRAEPDPHYGLRIVVCPGCAKACVRTRHPDQQFWRSVRRFRQSLRQLMLALVFTALSVVALIAMSFWLMPILTDRRARPQIPVGLDPQEITTVLVAITLVLLGGVMIRAVYAHLKFWGVWLILAIPTALFISIDYSVGHLLGLMARYAPNSVVATPPGETEIARRYESLLPIVVVATVGMLLGSLLNRHIAKRSGKRIVRIRRKLRKRQARLD